MSNQNTNFISLAEAAKLTNYSQDYISLLCRRGKMKGEKLGRNWFTTKEWIDNYINKTNGSGERIIPVRIESVSDIKPNSVSDNFEAKAINTNQIPADFLSLIKKLMFVIIIFSALISVSVFIFFAIKNS